MRHQSRLKIRQIQKICENYQSVKIRNWSFCQKFNKIITEKENLKSFYNTTKQRDINVLIFTS